jgi:hypothetical protein
MGKINARQRSYLESRFGNRVSLRKAERRLYGHDIAAVPSLIKPLIGDTTPEAVVQPETERNWSNWSAGQGSITFRWPRAASRRRAMVGCYR